MLASAKSSQPGILDALDSESESCAREYIDVQASVRFPKSERMRGPDSTVDLEGPSEPLIVPTLIESV